MTTLGALLVGLLVLLVLLGVLAWVQRRPRRGPEQPRTVADLVRMRETARPVAATAEPEDAAPSGPAEPAAAPTPTAVAPALDVAEPPAAEVVAEPVGARARAPLGAPPAAPMPGAPDATVVDAPWARAARMVEPWPELRANGPEEPHPPTEDAPAESPRGLALVPDVEVDARRPARSARGARPQAVWRLVSASAPDARSVALAEERTSRADKAPSAPPVSDARADPAPASMETPADQPAAPTEARADSPVPLADQPAAPTEARADSPVPLADQPAALTEAPVVVSAGAPAYPAVAPNAVVDSSPTVAEAPADRPPAVTEAPADPPVDAVAEPPTDPPSSSAEAPADSPTASAGTPTGLAAASVDPSGEIVPSPSAVASDGDAPIARAEPRAAVVDPPVVPVDAPDELVDLSVVADVPVPAVDSPAEVADRPVGVHLLTEAVAAETVATAPTNGHGLIPTPARVAGRVRRRPSATPAEQAAADLALLRTFGVAHRTSAEEPDVALEGCAPDDDAPVAGDAQPVSFHVLARDGSGIWGATVTLLDDHGRETASTRTNSEGRGVLTARRPGGYLLVTAAEGYQPGAITVAVTDEPVEADIPLTRSASIAGRVGGENGPVVGARLALVQDGEIVDSTESDPDGAYRFGDLAAGEYGLSVTAHECEPTVFVLALADEAHLRRDVELVPVGLPSDDVVTARR